MARSIGQFTHWFAYNSPWPRIGEFLLGALASQICLCGYKLGQRRADYLVAGCIAVIALMFLLMFKTQSLYGSNDMTLIAPSFALICLAVACCRSAWATRLLSVRLMILGGEASYSLYLIHSAVQVKLSEPAFNVYDMNHTYKWAIVSFIVSIALARLLYVYYERPAMNVLRRRRASSVPAIGVR